MLSQQRNISMWIISPRGGHFSIVVADDLRTRKPAPDRLMIRARSRSHLELLKAQHPILATVRIEKSKPGLDYPYRLVVDRSVLVQVFREMAEQIDWRNVKNEAHRNEADLGSDFVAAMHTVHATLARIKDAPSGPDLPKTP